MRAPSPTSRYILEVIFVSPLPPKENDKKKKNSKLQRSQSERLKGPLNRSHSSHGRLAQMAVKKAAAAAAAADSEPPAAASSPATVTTTPGGNSNKQMPANAKCPKLDKGENRYFRIQLP